MADLEVEARIRPYIPRRWQPNAGKVDVSSSSRTPQFVQPTEIKTGQYYSTTQPNQLSFALDGNGTFIFPSEAELNIGLVIVDSAEGKTYANGAPVAFATGLASTMFDRIQLEWGTTITSTPTLNGMSNFLSNLINYSYDYLLSGVYKLNTFILDMPGQTQNTSGDPIVYSGFTDYPTDGYYIPASKYVITFRANTATGTWDQGNQMGVTTSTKVVLADSNATLSTTTGFNPILLQSGTDNTAFWLRQALTNQIIDPIAPGGGTVKVWNTRLTMPELSTFFRSWTSFMIGKTLKMQLFPPQSINDMIQAAPYYSGTGFPGTPVNPAAVWIQSIWLTYPAERPSKQLEDEIDRDFKEGTELYILWHDLYTIYVTQMVQYQKSFTQQFSFSQGLVDWIVLRFIPSASIGNQFANSQVSLVSVPTNGTCVVSSAQLNYQGGNFPNPPYGQYNVTDNLRILKAFYTLCDRLDFEQFGPPIDAEQFLNNYMFLCFNSQDRTGSGSSNSTNINPNVTFTNGVPVTTDVIATGIKNQKSKFVIHRKGASIYDMDMEYVAIV